MIHRTFRRIAILAAVAIAGVSAYSQTETERRQAYLEQLKRILPESKPWTEWLAKSKELPPDFDSLPSRPELDALTFENGEKVTDPAGWARRRDELKVLFAKYVTGTVPPPPEVLKIEIIEEKKERGARSRLVKLSFGPENKASLRLELLLPDGKGPFPVFMTQHNHRDWAAVALSRGGIGCVYAGADSQDDTDTFAAAYPEYDWSRLMRRAWAAGRCVDYLIQSVPEADASRVLITGHSRNGKVAVMASMIDERFAAVIASSPGTGGVMPVRAFSEHHGGESIEMITREDPDWFHPRFRFFSGREDKLPVDFDLMAAMTAPRALLLSAAHNDINESVFAIEKTFLTCQRVYMKVFGVKFGSKDGKTLSSGSSAEVLWRSAGHETAAKDIERYLDWFERQARRPVVFESPRIFFPHNDPRLFNTAVNFGAPVVLKQGAPASLEDWRKKRAEIEAQTALMLGEAPPEVTHNAVNYGVERPYTSALLQRPAGEGGSGLERDQIMFGDYIPANIYLPAGTKKSGKRIPAVIWLHPFSVPNGYGLSYHHAEQFYIRLAREGYAVVCFDQCGFGRRIEELEYFYVKHPKWSWMGKMVRDTRAAIDALGRMPYVDPQHVAVVGYAMGAMVGLHECAFDERVKAFACVCAPQPFRLDPEKSSTGGLRRWTHVSGFMPNLGQFSGKESLVPYDFDELLASFAPRPVLVLSPSLDRGAKLEDVKNSVDTARKIYGLFDAAGKLEQSSPEDFNRLAPETQKIVIDWLKKVFAQ